MLYESCPYRLSHLTIASLCRRIQYHPRLGHRTCLHLPINQPPASSQGGSVPLQSNRVALVLFHPPPNPSTAKVCDNRVLDKPRYSNPQGRPQ